MAQCFRSIILLVVACGAHAQTPVANQTAGPRLKPVLDYISSAWGTLTRSMTDCQSIVDPKIKEAPVLYLPADMGEPAAVRKLSSECNVRVEHLPIAIHHLGEIDASNIQPPGLLYLENKYVVPG
ncbi:MAG: trehalase, partial [Candidatus Sulfotelmatobacter sp.]